MPHRHGFFFSFFFFFSILLFNHQQQSSTRGYSQIWLYNSESKVEIFKNPTIFWQLIGTYCPRPERHNSVNSLSGGKASQKSRTPTVVVRSFVRPSFSKLWEMNQTMMLGTHRNVCFRWSYCQNCKYARETELSPQ
jgi:hypothetical protein